MYKINTISKKLLADTTTPVSIYLRLRDIYPNSILLESSDYHSRENSKSYICAAPYAGMKVEKGVFSAYFPDGKVKEKASFNLAEEVELFKNSFSTEVDAQNKMITNGLFGYFSWNAIPYLEDIQFRVRKDAADQIPEMQYHLYRFIIVVDHFRNEITLFENTVDIPDAVQLDKLAELIQSKSFTSFKFSTKGQETSSMTDSAFIELVAVLQKHIQRGDVFQIVPSREFRQSFQGDEFNVYRCLRSINPSPYLFYFDYGNFRLFGSSPEAQITIQDNEAAIYPIAGTFKRTGNDREDAMTAKALEADPKESAEHVMLVDLARNDLSRHCDQVSVKAFKEVQYYSHLIHLVSKVSGQLRKEANAFNIVADTYPAGTLSGAPKYKAMQLLDEYETTARNFYAGAIGYMGFNNDFNHAIMIRTFLSQRNVLTYRAGAGIVFKSDPASELQEVNNKIAALRKAILMANEIH